MVHIRFPAENLCVVFNEHPSRITQGFGLIFKRFKWADVTAAKTAALAATAAVAVRQNTLVVIKLWPDPFPFRTRPSNAALPMVVVL